MPDSTDTFGIVFPCETETITLASLDTYTSGVEAAISTVDTVAVAAVTPPSVYVRTAAGMPLTVNVSTPVSFDTERYDRGGMFTLAAPTIITLPSNGTYLATARFERNTSAGTFTSFRGAILIGGVERGYHRAEAATGGIGFTVQALLPSATAGQQVTVNALYTGTLTAVVSVFLDVQFISTT